MSTRNRIDSFKGSDYFLSNFYPVPVHIGDMTYPTSEHAYQALKTNDPEERKWIAATMTPFQAKTRGREVTLLSYWEDVKLRVMAEVLQEKFRDPQLADLLVATYPKELIEGNDWHDNYWGDCYCGDEHCTGPGANVLGELLMELRDELRKHRASF